MSALSLNTCLRCPSPAEGPKGLCVACHDEQCRSEAKEIHSRYYRNRVPKRRESLYGISPDQYEAMYTVQQGRCKICRSERGLRDLHIDHCHKSGIVRGILCHGCNTSLGHFRDDVNLLQRAIDYLNDTYSSSIPSPTTNNTIVESNNESL